MRIRFFSNMIFFRSLKDSLCSSPIKKLEITPKTLESLDCAQGAQITTNHSIIPNLEIKKQEIKEFPEIQSSFHTENSPYNFLVLKGTDCLSRNQSVSSQPKEALSANANLIREFKKTAEQFDKALIVESKDNSYIMMEAVSPLKTTNDELNDLFTNLKYEPTQVPEFYDYFDVLGYIDKSIIHIQGFLETLSGNYMANFFKTREDMIEKIDLEFKSFEILYKQAEELYKDQKSQKKKPSEFDFFEDGLTGIKSQKKFFNERYIKYRSFPYQDYLKAIFLKHNKLRCLETYLKKVRGVVCPLSEENIKEHAILFKIEFKRVVKEVFEKLVMCHEKEKNIFNFVFEILNGILKGIRECKNELEVIKNIIENNRNPIKDE